MRTLTVFDVFLTDIRGASTTLVEQHHRNGNGEPLHLLHSRNAKRGRHILGGGLIGLILAISAKNEGNDEGIRKAGFILGIIGCALWAVGIVVAIINDSFSTWMY